MQRVEELQEQAAVEVHGPGHVAESDDAGLPRLAAPEAQIERLGPGGERAPHGPAQIDARSAPCRFPAATRPRGEAAGEARRDPLDFLQVARRERGEVLVHQRAAVARAGHFLRLFAGVLLPLL